MKIPTFKTKKELFKFLFENKAVLESAKKSTIKYSDAVAYSPLPYTEKGLVDKAIDNPSEFAGDELKVKLVINTTNVMDSHDDVHFPGIWTKSLQEKTGLMLLQEHKNDFEHVISDEVKAKAINMPWKELGVDIEGKSQALVFESTIEKERNEFMFKQYLKGYVKNHSVGMQYVNIELAMNSEYEGHKEQKKVWDKYIDKIINKEAAEAHGYFYAVKEAKVIEGSAVVKGSNQITPTLEVNEKGAAGESTPGEPLESTQKTIMKNFKLL